LDIAGTVGISFSINHIAAVVIPVVFGIIWLSSLALLDLIGAAVATVSFALSLQIPEDPAEGRRIGRIQCECNL
jgi:hypothetical protein